MFAHHPGVKHVCPYPEPQASQLDLNFVLPATAARPEGVKALEFDALLLAEGEWSATSKRLGIASQGFNNVL